ncbi:MAG: isocitrate lyase/phosphoenolpyruvate mutase family protein [Chitinophagaceae bacterium]
MNKISQKEKAEKLRELHHSGKMIILPNIWDVSGALLMESLEYPVIATASASVAFSNGYNDGENIPFNDLLVLLKKITGSVSIPVTADIESGYADNDIQLKKNIKLLIDTGIAGINFEDTDRKTNSLYSVEVQGEKIRIIRKVAGEMGIPVFINARTDVYLRAKQNETDESKFAEVIKRGLAYKEAGADGFFPIALRNEEDIKEVIDRVNLPVNIITIPGIPELKTLSKLGVARVSLGPSLFKIAIRAMKDLAMQLKDYEGLSVITANEITTDYLKNLVNKVPGK